MSYIFGLDRIDQQPATLETTVQHGDNLIEAFCSYVSTLHGLIKEDKGGDLVCVKPSESGASTIIICTHKSYKLTVGFTEDSLIDNILESYEKEKQ
jgi:hypothetical protein